MQKDVDKQWSDRMKREEKIVLSKVETLNSAVERQGQEVMNLKKMVALPAPWPRHRGAAVAPLAMARSRS